MTAKILKHHTFVELIKNSFFLQKSIVLCSLIIFILKILLSIHFFQLYTLKYEQILKIKQEIKILIQFGNQKSNYNLFKYLLKCIHEFK